MTLDEKTEEYCHSNCGHYGKSCDCGTLCSCKGCLKYISYKDGATDVCKHILAELEKHSVYGTELIRDIIKNYGVEV